MPVKTKTESWVQHFRNQLKTFMEHKAPWYVQESRKKIRLIVIEDGKTQTLTLENDWSFEGSTKAISRISLIYKNFYSDLGNRSLEKSANVVDKSSSNTEIDFKEIFIEFRAFCPSASEETWNKSYVPVLHTAQELLERSKGKPQNGEELLLLSLKKWEQGSRSRQIARRSLSKFLNWATQRNKLPSSYCPPATVPEIRKPKKIGYAFRDSEILALIEDEKDPKWQFAFQLLAVLGLRPEELRWLRIVDGVEGKELWSTYRKSMGGLKGAKTKPRKLEPLLVRDMDGNEIDWKLQERIEIGEELPSLGQDGQGSLYILTHIRRNKIYKQIKEEALKIGQEAVPYSFRHRYAKESHASGFPVNNIAEAMGHSPEVHWQNYSRFKPSGTTAMYRNRNKQTA